MFAALTLLHLFGLLKRKRCMGGIMSLRGQCNKNYLSDQYTVKSCGLDSTADSESSFHPFLKAVVIKNNNTDQLTFWL
jgi:hypothetical protein